MKSYYRRKIEFIFIGCFILTIFLPAVGVFIKPDVNKFMVYEQRPITPWPNKLTLKKGTFQELEKWFGDRFLFRWDLTEAWSKLNFLAHVSSRPERVVIGKENWLFLGNNWNKTIDQYRGFARPSEQEIEQKALFFKQMRDYCNEKRIPFILVIAPDKQSIYPEYLPAWVGKRSEFTRLNLMKKELEEQGISVVDLTETELKAKQSYPKLYYEGDSHWNRAGAYYGFLDIQKELISRHVEIREFFLEDTDFEVNVKKATDISNMLQLNDFKSTEIMAWNSKHDGELLAAQNNVFKSWQAIDEVNNGMIMSNPLSIINDKVPNNTKVLFLRDSFGTSMAPFLHQIAKETVHLHYGNGPHNNFQYSMSNLIDIYTPNAVIFEVVERELAADIPSFFRSSSRIDKEITSNTAIKYNVERINSEGDKIAITGWAFIPDVPAKKYQTYVFLKNESGIIYTYLPRRIIRGDVTKHFQTKESQDLSGFEVVFANKDLPEGKYEIGVFLVANNGQHGAILTQKFILKTPDNVFITK